jgi:hypothetical protein
MRAAKKSLTRIMARRVISGGLGVKKIAVKAEWSFLFVIRVRVVDLS